MGDVQETAYTARSIWGWLLDASVYFSFDSTGYRRHASHFTPLPEDVSGLKVVITGANSGIGYACAEEVARRGGAVVMICRDQARGEEARSSIISRATPNIEPQLILADMTDHERLSVATEQIEGPIHALIHNAGLLPLHWSRGACGHELTVGVHLLGPTWLTQRLTPQLIEGGRALQQEGQREGARVIWMSSGGMYTKGLDLEYLRSLSAERPARYDGVVAYAYTKRAQVELATLFNTLKHGEGYITHHSAHPGWVDTPGVQTSLPGFWRWTQGRLRSLAEGADTAVWLALTPERLTPGLWFDRVARSPYLLGKRPEPAQREALLMYLNEELGLPQDWVTQ